MGFSTIRVVEVLFLERSLKGSFAGFYGVYHGLAEGSLRVLHVSKTPPLNRGLYIYIWVVVKIMVPLWVPIIIRHLLFRVPQKGP